MKKLILLTTMLMGVLTMSCAKTGAALPIEDQITQLATVLDGQRVGFLTNPTSVDGQYRHLADRLHADPNVQLVCFFAPEHGLRGDNQAGGGDTDYTDPATGLPVYSLYGSGHAPSDEELAELDTLLFDIQDVGARFYTYVWTMTHAMEAAAKNGKKFVVFDRPNPIGIHKVEGAPIPFDSGLIGRKWPDAPFGVATRHGLTAGELATLVNEEWMDPKVDLTVVAVPGYTRGMSFEETGYPWVMPSPNMPTQETAQIYPGSCIFEGANVSEGRGTTRPFELIGAPFIDARELANRMNALNLPGVRFRELYFTPVFDDHSGQQCAGVQIHVTDPATYDAVAAGLHLLKAIHTLHPGELEMRNWVSRLMGVENLEERIQTESVEAIIAGWQDDLAAYMQLREKHLIYPAGEGWEIK